MPGGAHRLAVAGMALALAGTPAHASFLRVVPEAAMAGTAYGLELTLIDPARVAATDAWVAVGPESGLQAEAALQGRFWIDVSQLTMRSGGSPEALPMLAFLETFEPGGERLSFFLSQSADGSWSLGAWVRDDASQQPILAGWGFLAPGHRPSCQEGGRGTCNEVRAPPESAPPAPAGPVLVEFEWGTARDGLPGYLSVYRRESETQARQLVFGRSDLDNASQSLSYLRLGVEARHHLPGTRGALRIDELAIFRGLLPPVAAGP